MKRVIWVVIAVGFLAVSCGGGGGNINKVKNGVFSSVDSTITVGQAFANDATLKNGKWEAYEKDGREIVSYTVKFSQQQINAMRNNEKPNFAIADKLFTTKNMVGWDFIFQRLQPLDKEEQQQFKTAFESAFEPLRIKPSLNEAQKDYTVYFDSWLIDHLDDFVTNYRNKITAVSYLIEVISKNYKKMETPDVWYEYKQHFVNYGFGSPELETALKNSMVNYAEVVVKNHEARLKEWETTDIKPLVTVNGGSIAFFFIMDQADKDAFNVGGLYFEEELTLNCFNNKKVTWELEYTTPNKILEYIYKPASRGFDFL